MSEFYENEVKPFLDADNSEDGEIVQELFWGGSMDADMDMPFDAKCVDSYGGEDQGSSFYSTVKFSKDGQECFVHFTGWYASHQGSELEEYYEVSPQVVVKEVTEYKKV